MENFKNDLIKRTHDYAIDVIKFFDKLDRKDYSV
jgi:hypothetical protein